MLEAPDTVRATLKSLMALDLADCDLDVCVASGEASDEELRYRHIRQKPALQQKFREVIGSILDEYRKGVVRGDLELQTFQAGSAKEEREIEYLNILPYDSIRRRIQPLNDPIDLPFFQHSEEAFIEKMRFYAMRVVPKSPQSATPIYFYRVYNASQMLNRSRFYAMIVQDDIYEDLRTPTFLFDRHIDCISYENDMFIFNTHNFHQIFNSEEFKKAAAGTLDRLKQKDFIYNYDRFRTDCLNDKNKILKLCKISASSYLDALTIDILHAEIERLKLPITVEIVNGKKKMVYNPRGDRWAILKLLNDSYARSSMTNIDYYVSVSISIARKTEGPGRRRS